MEHGIKTIAFPSISTGVYGYPVAQAAVVALHAVKQFLAAHNGLDDVRFVLFDDATHDAYENALADDGSVTLARRTDAGAIQQFSQPSVADEELVDRQQKAGDCEQD